jgi:hypothetical protein
MRTGKRLTTWVLVTAVLVIAGCQREHLRGRAEPSPDGRTYLVIADDIGGACGAIFVDDREWAAPIDRPHPISPGHHVIRCGPDGAIDFEVPEGTTFHFDYWVRSTAPVAVV